MRKSDGHPHEPTTQHPPAGLSIWLMLDDRCPDLGTLEDVVYDSGAQPLSCIGITWRAS